MNVIFHITTAVGITLAMTDTSKIIKIKDTLLPSIGAFIGGVIIHGAIDYMPHTYPLSGMADCAVSLLLIAALIALAKNKFRPILFFAILGSIFPDLVDLLPNMLNKYLQIGTSQTLKVFPWHYPEYSGSIFSTQNNTTSNINHLLVIVLTATVCWCRKGDFLEIFFNNHKVRK